MDFDAELFVSDGGAFVEVCAEDLVHRGAQIDTMRGFEEDQVTRLCRSPDHCLHLGAVRVVMRLHASGGCFFDGIADRDAVADQKINPVPRADTTDLAVSFFAKIAERQYVAEDSDALRFVWQTQFVEDFQGIVNGKQGRIVAVREDAVLTCLQQILTHAGRVVGRNAGENFLVRQLQSLADRKGDDGVENIVLAEHVDLRRMLLGGGAVDECKGIAVVRAQDILGVVHGLRIFEAVSDDLLGKTMSHQDRIVVVDDGKPVRLAEGRKR